MKANSTTGEGIGGEGYFPIAPRDYNNSREMDILTVCISKSDAQAMLAMFGSLSKILQATQDEIRKVPGIGEKKVRKFWETFHTEIC